MKNATFYLLDNDATVDGLSAVEQLVCDIAAERWRNGKRVLIACEDEQQAIRLDEALWSRPPESFVPHNLAGEGPRGGAPVEIAWPQKRNSSPRDILISLRLNFADFATAFTEVIDFVPYEDNLKQLARERYKAYRMAGFFVIGADLSGILLWKTSFKKIYHEWVDIAAMFSVDVPGDLWIDQISATGIPSSRVVLGRME